MNAQDPNTPNEIERLIALMAKLPGLGPRSARRAALYLARHRDTVLGPLAQAMAEMALKAQPCTICGNIDTAEICSVCRDPRRSDAEICVVEEVGDLWGIERASAFKGRYHVLGGALSALAGVGPEQLRIPELAARAAKPEVREVVLALSATVDGQTTAHVIAEALKSADVTVTTLARGVPFGGEVGDLDEGTLGAALGDRRAF